MSAQVHHPPDTPPPTCRSGWRLRPADHSSRPWPTRGLHGPGRVAVSSAPSSTPQGPAAHLGEHKTPALRPRASPPRTGRCLLWPLSPPLPMARPTGAGPRWAGVLTVGRLRQVKAEQVVGLGAVLPVAHDQLPAVPTLETDVLVQLLGLGSDFSSLRL